MNLRKQAWGKEGERGTGEGGGGGEGSNPALIRSCHLASAQNVKKWETEMQTLKNNNVQLTAALEESRQHVTEWKKQLQKYKEESEALRKKAGVPQHFKSVVKLS